MKSPRASLPPATIRFTLSLAMFAWLAFPGAALAAGEPKVGIFGDVRVEKGEVHEDDLVCIGGKATVEGRVEGDVVVVGGELDFSGEARSVVSILSRTRVAAGSIVNGDLVNVLGRFERDPAATVQGEAVDVGSRLPPDVQRILSRGLIGLFVLLRILSLIVSLVLLLLIALLAPARVERMSAALEDRWPASLGFGILGMIVCVVLCIGLAITLVGIPLAILLGLGVKLLGLMGVAAILVLVGRKVGSGTGLLGPAPSVLSAVVVGFLVVAVVRFIPLIGELFWMVLSVLGLGLVLVTKLGSPAVGSAPGAPAVRTAAGSTS